MCTVTYIPTKKGFFLTSNRDEKTTRKAAIKPFTYTHHNLELLYPKDADAGGTWIAVAQNGNAAVLLNGAFKKHTSTAPYCKSRGIIFIEILSSYNPYSYFLQTNLDNIEPFTLVLYCNNNLYVLRWDGNSKYYEILNKQLPHIWSSATLYSNEVIKKRENWFAAWQKINLLPTQNDILKFHQFAGDGDVENSLLMNRNNTTFTVSITSIEWSYDKAMMIYSDLINKQQSLTPISFSNI